MVMPGFKQDFTHDQKIRDIISKGIDDQVAEIKREQFIAKMQSLQKDLETYSKAYGELQDYAKALEDENEQMRNNFIEMKKNIAYLNDSKAMNEGLKAVARALMAKLREVDPNNPLLDKKVRDKLYREHEQAEINRINAERKANGLEPYQELIKKTPG